MKTAEDRSKLLIRHGKRIVRAGYRLVGSIRGGDWPRQGENADERMGTLAAAEPDVGAKHDFLGGPEGKAATKAVAHFGQTKIRSLVGYLAGIVEGHNAKGFPDAAIEFHFDGDIIGGAEAVVRETAQGGVAVNIGAAERILQIKGNGMAGGSLRQRQAAIERKDAVTAFLFAGVFQE
jgi:hypothetical protein